MTVLNLIIFGRNTFFGTYYLFLADPGEARGSSTNSLVIHLYIQSVSLFLPQLYGAATPERFEIALPVKKIDHVIVIRNSLNPDGHENPISGSKVKAILPKGLI